MKKKIDKLKKLLDLCKTPIKNVAFKEVIEAISGKKVIEFDENNKHHQLILDKIAKAAEIACNDINKTGRIISKRVNEVGNKVEKPIKDALKEVGFVNVDTPVTEHGIKKTMGYPDISFKYNHLQVYLECKTYNKNNIKTTQRSFYFSPTTDFKVNEDGLHLVISLEIEKKSNTQNKGNEGDVYIATAWKVVRIDNLLVDLKLEFNSSNSRLYEKDQILKEGKISNP